MKRYLLILLSGFLIIALSGNAIAKPSFGNNCGACHGVPVVADFDLPASHDGLTVPINSFAATDSDPQKSSLAGVSGYLLTTTNSTPEAGDPAWSSMPPAAYTFASEGLQTLYAWVKDSLGIVSASMSDAVTISIAANVPPVADAGPDQTVNEGVAVILNGSNSDDSDDGIAAYLWEQIDGPVAVEVFNPTSDQATFDTPNVGLGGAALTFRLTVTDASGATDTDTTIVNVSWVNIQPVANAGIDQTVTEGTPVTLDGFASDGVDDGIAAYSWNQVDINGVIAVLTGSDTANPTFTIMDVGANGESLTFELTVTDEGGLQATDRVVVNVTNVNQVPVADAGADQSVASGDEVVLDGSGSFDPDNDINPDTAYSWKQTAGSAVTLSAPGAVMPIFIAPEVSAGGSETLIFELTVTDNGLLKATDTCNVQVNGPTPPPVEEPPVVEPPVEQPPVEEPPVVEPPVEQPPVEEPPVVEPPVEQPPVEEPPVVEPPVEQPPVEEPPVVEPPVEQPPVEEPPVVEPPVEQPPVEEPPVIEPPTEQPPSEALFKEYMRLAKQYRKAAAEFRKKSKSYKKLYRKYRQADATTAQAYLDQALAYKAQSLDAKWQSKQYRRLAHQVKRQLENADDEHEHEDDDDDDHESDDDEKREHEDDRDDD